MIFSIQLFLCFIYILRIVFAIGVDYSHEEKGKEFLKILNEKSARIASKLVKAQWDFETENNANADEEFFQTTSEAIKNIKLDFENVVRNYPWWSFSDPDTQRQFKLYSEIGILALPSDEYRKFQDIVSDVNKIRRDATICDFYNKTKCNLQLQPGIQDKLSSSENAEELLYLVSEWKKATRYKLSKLLQDYVKLCNTAAVFNNYTNFREYSLRQINLSYPAGNMTTLWESVKPLYYQIHAYVRRKLREIYGDKVVPRKGSIPSYLLGNIWYEDWSGIASKILPFPELDNLNFTAVMINQGLTPETIHQHAESFFVSMNFSIPSSLWYSDSLEVDEIKKMENCHPKLFNFLQKNVRIKDCGKVSMKDFLTAIGLLFKAQYVIQYSHQPFVYQKPADPGLEIALNDLIVMCSSTFSTLKKLGLYKDEINEKVRLNRLFRLALEKVVAIPFLLVQEFWRWEIYGGRRIEDTTNSLNDLREKFQGISTFTKELNFDPGGTGSVFSKFSLAHHFFSYFLEFHIYDVLCNKSRTLDGFYENFDECNLYDREEVGSTLRNLMSLGSSKLLGEALNLTLGIKNITSESLLKYFEPLRNWLTEENKKTEEFIGWSNSDSEKIVGEKKRRRKRSVERYPLESNDDTENDDMYNNNPTRERTRFEHTMLKRSKNYNTGFDRKKKSAEEEPKKNEQKTFTNKNNEAEEKKNSEKVSEGSKEWKVRRSLSRNTKNAKDNSKESENEDQKFYENSQVASYHSPKNKKRRTDYESQDQASEKNNKNSNNKGFYQKRSDKYSGNINYENIGTGGNIKKDVDGESSARYAMKVRNKQRRHMNEASFSHYDSWQKKDQGHQKDRYLRGASYHSDTKKDISRLLHSFGFAVENEDKEKIKELKKKLKGDSNSDLKSSIISKGNSYENLIDLNRVKSVDGRLDADDKGMDKLWAVKSYLNENVKTYQRNPSLNKKDSTSFLTEEKSIGKKETSFSNNQNMAAVKDKILDNLESRQSQAAIRRLNLDFPSLQALLKNTDLSSYEQKPGFTMNGDLIESKAKNDLIGSKTNNNKVVFKYSPNSDSLMFKDKKEYRDDMENTNKSPYIIILSQLTPELREQLLKDKRTMIAEKDKSSLQNVASLNEEPSSDKRSVASEQILILPIKNSQYNLPKTNHHDDHDFEGRNEPNAERDQEIQEEQSHTEESSQFEDEGNLYRKAQNSPSEFIISWNDKSKKSVKRSKREHRKELDENNLKVVKIAPMKQSILEGLLGKSLDRANLDDKNVKILIHDGLLNGDTDLSSAIASLSSSGNQNFGSSLSSLETDQGQGQSLRDQSVPLQPGSPASSLSSSILSAFSPKSYSQIGKPNLQHQDAEIDEDNVKESNAAHGSNKEPKEQELPFLLSPNLRCNNVAPKKKGAKFFTDDEKKVLEDAAAKDNEISCKKLILTPCPPKNPTTGPSGVTIPGALPFPSPLPYQQDSECTKKPECNNFKTESPDSNKSNGNNKASECSVVNCQFKITKAKKPHERLTIMIYDRINPPTELPEPFDALAVISEILQRIQSCSNKPTCQLTEEDPDYPVNDNSDQLKSGQNQPMEMNTAKVQEMNGEMPILPNDNSDDDDSEDNPQNSVDSNDDGKYQTKEKATPAIDQLTVFNRDKLKPLFIDIRKIDDLMKKRSQ